MAQFKLSPDNHKKLAEILADDFVENCGLDELKLSVKEFLTDGMGEMKPYHEMKDEELIKELKCFDALSIGDLVNKLVSHGVDEKDALLIAHEFSSHVEELAEDELDHSADHVDEGTGEPTDLEDVGLPE